MHETYFRGDLIDVHKILACMVAALADANMIRYDDTLCSRGNKPPCYVAFAKYQVALLAPMRFLYLFMQEKFKYERGTDMMFWVELYNKEHLEYSLRRQ